MGINGTDQANTEDADRVQEAVQVDSVLKKILDKIRADPNSQPGYTRADLVVSQWEIGHTHRI